MHKNLYKNVFLLFLSVFWVWSSDRQKCEHVNQSQRTQRLGLLWIPQVDAILAYWRNLALWHSNANNISRYLLQVLPVIKKLTCVIYISFPNVMKFNLAKLLPTKQHSFQQNATLHTASPFLFFCNLSITHATVLGMLTAYFHTQSRNQGVLCLLCPFAIVQSIAY